MKKIIKKTDVLYTEVDIKASITILWNIVVTTILILKIKIGTKTFVNIAWIRLKKRALKGGVGEIVVLKNIKELRRDMRGIFHFRAEIRIEVRKIYIQV